MFFNRYEDYSPLKRSSDINGQLFFSLVSQCDLSKGTLTCVYFEYEGAEFIIHSILTVTSSFEKFCHQLM